MASISGSVDRIVFRNAENGFCVARFHLADERKQAGGVTTIVGTLPDVHPGEMLRLDGIWETHPIHGRNFRVERFEEELPTHADGIERYLASGVIRGVGPVTAARIVDLFGEQSIEVLDREPDKLRQVAGISAKRVQVISASWEEQKRIRDLSMFLQDCGISVALARRIFEAYGDRAREVITADPYQLAHEIHGIGFLTADALARSMGVPRDSLSRYVAGVRYVLSEATEEGHVFLPRRALLQRAARVLAADPRELEPALLDLLRRRDAVIDDDCVYLAPFYRAESGIARMLDRLKNTPSPLIMDRRFDAAVAVRQAGAEQGLVLAEKQIQAAEQSLREKVSVLTGGPGTGKTSTLRTIITALESANVPFCLAAPTGRAAKRVAETTGRPASTIHRLLEFQAGLGIFLHDQHRPLPHDFVVVDEVSMLDVLLFYHLLKAIPPEAHLLLVGDADQLPAVGPGRVLRDLIESESIPTVTLTELFRQARGSQIILAAHAVNQGQIPMVESGDQSDFFFVPARDDDHALNTILKLVTERIPRKFGLDPRDDVQVISPMHAGPVGVTSMNTALQRLLNPPGSGQSELARGTRVLRTGDKVMQIRNNYDKDVYNGDIGRVSAIRPDEQELEVLFAPDGEPVLYAANDLDDLTLAYVVSVHKAQGSEFPCVVMPLATRHYMLLQRHLLYTAITRARQVCLLVGSRRALQIAVETDRRERRHTRLALRLRDPAAAQLELA
jgi:exodeoxyribonuclease V alpha subunit